MSSNPDFWGWVEVELISSEEPGLYALQTRPPLASGQEPKVSIGTFSTEQPTISSAWTGGGTSFPITAYANNGPVHGDGIGNWGFNKNHIVWIYDNTDFEGESSPDPDTYIAIADTSARPVEAIDPEVDFTANLFYFPIHGNDLWNPHDVRSVPPLSETISFLARPGEEADYYNIYIISATVPVIMQVISAGDLRPGADSVGYHAWSADGRYLLARVDDRMIIQERLTGLIVLDVVSTYDRYPPQFSDDGVMVYYTSGGVLHLRREATDWIVDETVNETGTYTCQGTRNFTWDFAKVSPDGNYWMNNVASACGGAFDLSYRSFVRFFDKDFNLLASNNMSAFASGTFMGDFTNDSRWYRGGDGNINGNSQVTFGPAPSWNLSSQGSSSTGANQMRSFQAF